MHGPQADVRSFDDDMGSLEVYVDAVENLRKPNTNTVE